MSYLEAFLSAHRQPTKLTEPPSVRSVSAYPPRIALDRGLAVREVVSFPAALLASLPLATSLVVARTGNAERVTLAATSREWADLISSATLPPSATVGEVLALHGLSLLAVVIAGDGGKP